MSNDKDPLFGRITPYDAIDRDEAAVLCPFKIDFCCQRCAAVEVKDDGTVWCHAFGGPIWKGKVR